MSYYVSLEADLRDAGNLVAADAMRDLRLAALAFGVVCATRQAEEAGQRNVLRQAHYDLLKACGGRMDDFTRGPD